MHNRFNFDVTPELEQAVKPTAELRLRASVRELDARVDRLFAWLMACQAIGGVAVALFISPAVWSGVPAPFESPLLTAVFVGGLLTAVACCLSFCFPGRSANRFFMAAAQGCFTALFVQLTDGRDTSTYHLFGSLAFLALYRDWRVLGLASVAALAEQFVRGQIFSNALTEVNPQTLTRLVETGVWILFQNVVLMVAIDYVLKALRTEAEQWAMLSAAQDLVQAEVDRQTADLTVSKSEMMKTAERLQFMIDASYDAFVEFDGDLHVTLWSKRAKELLGWPDDEIVGFPFFRVIGAQDLHKGLRMRLDRLSQGGKQEPFLIETVVYTADGRRITVEAFGSFAMRNDGMHINVFLRDLTQRLARTEKELQAQKLESLGHLATGIAHEINSPTQFVSDNLAFLEDSFKVLDSLIAQVDATVAGCETGGITTEALGALRRELNDRRLQHAQHEIPKAIQQTRDGIDRIGSITRAMKEFSQPQNQEMATVDLSRLIENVLVVCRNEWRYVADITTHFDPEVTTVYCMPGCLSQVVLNLVVNAAHAIADVLSDYPDNRGLIEVHTRRVGDGVEIDVKDNGPGIPPSIRERIFDPFFTTKAVGRGTGQGLATAQSIVSKHNGTLTLSTEVGVGTTFSIRIPISSKTHEQIELF
ncbi:MAG: ATP-binding protein [Pirellulales bacterium]